MEKHIVASFGPDGQYTRHSEGAFIRLLDGRIMFVYSRFTGSQRDDAPSDLVAIYSSDEGETWTEARSVIRAAQYNTKNVMSVSLLRMQNGDIGLFYIVKQTPAVSRIMLSRSADEGESYYKHVECTRPERAGYYVLNNDRVERLSGGRILAPLALHRGANEAVSSGYIDSRSFNCFVYSDDDGETWNEAPDAVFPAFTGTDTGLQEPGVIEKLSGVLWAYSRTDMMYQYEYFSMDGGIHWTSPQPSRFTSPPSPMKLKRDPATGALYAFWNPVPLYNGRVKSPSGWGRTPLAYSISYDDGVSWTEQEIIEDKDEHGFCYPAIFFTSDGGMLAAYCSGGPADGICLARLTIMKLPCPGKPGAR